MSIILETQEENFSSLLPSAVAFLGHPNLPLKGFGGQTMDGILKIRRSSIGKAEQLLPDTLAEVQGLHVWISQVDPSLIADGLDRERLWEEVGRRLEKAGLPVPKHQPWQQTPRFPCLGVLVHADLAQVTPPFYVFSVEVFFVQKLLIRGTPPANSMRMAWCREAIGEVSSSPQGFDWTNLYNTVGTLIDQILVEYLDLKLPGSPEKIRMQ